MKRIVIGNDFDRWRDVARALASHHVAPREVDLAADAAQTTLFGENREPPKSTNTVMRVPPSFADLSRWVSLNRSPVRWNLLYAALFRVTRGERHLLELATDPLVLQLRQLERQCREDEHRARAFVRFRPVTDASGERYVAFYRPDHYIVREVAPFFADRFPSHRWSLLTPDESVHFDGEALTFAPGATPEQCPGADDLEGLWRTYYANIFNPARVNQRAMLRHMPSRFHALMPETALIKPLVRAAAPRVQRMRTTESSAASAFVPPNAGLTEMSAAISNCGGCTLCAKATAPVFGEGKATARLMLVGEQPGDQEDLQGRPFVGPAGALLNELLLEAGISRDDAYVTNAVKAFKFEYDGKRRIHQKPSGGELKACRAWLEAEVAAVKPKVIVCLGASAGQSFLGSKFSLTRSRGEVMHTPWAAAFIATWHPSAALRAFDEAASTRIKADICNDLKLAAAALR